MDAGLSDSALPGVGLSRPLSVAERRELTS